MAADYTDEQRGKNQLSIVRGTLMALALVAVSGTMQSWSLGSFGAASLVIIVVAAILWRLFAAGDARPLPTDRKHARWPYLSKKKMDEITDSSR